MRKISRAFTSVAPVIAFVSTGASASSGQPQALVLNVQENSDSVEVELIAQSKVAQQVEYKIELVGNSRARHRGNTSIVADERHVLSKLKTSVSGDWCATVDVTEESGASYTLTAGPCSAS